MAPASLLGANVARYGDVRMDVDGSPMTHAAELVELTLPLRPRSAVTARLVAASLGAECGFDVDEIDDLRLAVDEAVGAIVDQAGDHVEGRVMVQFGPGASALQVRVATTGGRFDGARLDPLAARIIGAMVDHFEVVDGAFVLTKRHADRDGG